MTELAEALQYLFTIQRYLLTIQNYINSWWVVLDIALASLLIYELLVLVRDSRFGQMILSGVLIWLEARDKKHFGILIGKTVAFLELKNTWSSICSKTPRNDANRCFLRNLYLAITN